ncbi:Multidrug resistance protein MdtH [Actinomadura rubteroloni]|uniref:Multidrug resistance protein MdtH n=1 Tax=Actinomadura rubteroloni TaxID=1926885 RepID=A0A2P4UGJ6_9ACTN|nr:MFS transporter [Actinomadura rubteroloni]POM24194.1 Multidrug resistance protein MdtH [Actinomadura rubteroloni]
MASLDSPAPPGRFAAFLAPRIGGLPRVFWVLWAGTLINRLGTMVEPFLGLYLVTARGLSVGAAGAVVAVLGAGSLAGQLAGGYLADRVGRRVTLTGGTVGAGAAMLAVGYADGIPSIIAAALACGFFLDMHRPASAAVVADVIGPHDRPRAFGLLFWAVNLGFATAMVLGGVLAAHGYLLLFWIDALTCAAYGLLVWRAVPETRPERTRDDAGGGFADVLRDRVLVAYVGLSAIYVFVILQSMTTMPLAMRADGLGPGAYGAAVAANGVLIVVVQPVVNTWLARRDHSRVLVAGNALAGVGIGLTALVDSLPGYIVTVLLWTCGEIVSSAVLQAVVADLAPPHLRGRYNAAYGVAWAGGYLVAPLGGTQLLGLGAPVLWLTSGGLGLAAALGQLALAPAIRRRHFSSV